MGMDEYFEANRLNWNDRSQLHVDSADRYGVPALLQDPHAVSNVVRFDQPRLGDIAGLNGIHLQCHLGTDTLSLARMGATMAGIDLSDQAIKHARDIAQRCEVNVDYHVSNVYDTLDTLAAAGARTEYDLVYTGIGAIGWLPDLGQWADVVASLLSSGGRFFMRELHPMCGTLDDTLVAELAYPLAYPYFSHDEPLAFDDDTSYVDSEHKLTATRCYEWTHNVGDVVTALLSAGLQITGLEEHDSAPFKFFSKGLNCDAHGEFRLAAHPERLAASYTVQAMKA